ncbi:MAG: AMP-dependent synthetase/ligase [Chitinophagales bacterium]
MKDYSRLFEIIQFQEKKYPQQDCLNYKYNGKWRNYSTSEVNSIINNVSKAFIASGIKKDDKVAIISSNRPEWNFIDNGMLQIGAINVPIYPTISEKDYLFIFNDAEIKMVFVEDQDLYEKIKSIKSQVPTLQAIYSFEDLDDCENWQDFVKKGADVDPAEIKIHSDKVKPNELATIIYTSGTTGLPKGVMLSHDNIVSNIKSVRLMLPVASEAKALSFLPLCHIFERTVTYAYFAKGVSIYYAESLETIGDDLKDVKPHFFSTVPRLLEKVYDKIITKGLELTGLKKKLFFWAHDEVAMNYTEDYTKGLKWKIADKLIFSKWREALGGNVIGVVTGAAALQEKLAKVFSCAGVEIREGYGQTETSPVITVNRFEKGGYKFGTAGPVIPGVEIKFGERDEILCKGPNVMLGYYKRPDITAETIDEDGWLHTGDVGKLVDGKFLKITDRIKSLFKTSGGKYVAPAVVEEKMKECRYIEQMMVIGENQKFVAALIVPSIDFLKEWCEDNNVKCTTTAEIVKAPEVLSLLKSEIDILNKNFGKVEQIKKFELLADEWTIESGEMTPTMKVKRKVVKEKYKTLIEDIYNV